MDPGDELVDVVDEQNEVVGVVPRRTLRDENLLHRCTYVFVLNRAGELYVHRRTDTKDVYPGFYDVGAGGVNSAGESYNECSRRQLEEELGVAAEPNFRFLHRYEGPSGRVWGGAFDVVWDGPIVWQPSEVGVGSVRHVRRGGRDGRARARSAPTGSRSSGRWRREVQPS